MNELPDEAAATEPVATPQFSSAAEQALEKYEAMLGMTKEPAPAAALVPGAGLEPARPVARRF